MDKMVEKNEFKKHRGVSFALAFVLIIVIIFFLIVRMRFGIDLSDEGWYVAEPYAVAEMGVHPYVDNVTQSPGFMFPVYVFFKIFCSLSGSSEGIFLFSRYLYLGAAFGLSFLTIWFVNHYSKFHIPFLFFPYLLVSSNIHSLFDLNYNTIGLIYMPLILALIFSDFENESSKDRLKGIVAGLLAVRTITATPHSLIGLVVVFIYLICKKKYRKIQGIIIGCVAFSLGIVGYSTIIGGNGAFINWIRMFFGQAYFSIQKEGRWDDLPRKLLLLFIPGVILFLFCSFIRHKHESKEDIYSFVLRLVVVFAATGGLIGSFLFKDYYGISFACCTCFSPYIYCYFFPKKDSSMQIVEVINLAYLCIFFFAAASDSLGFATNRLYWLYVPIGLTMCLLINDSNSQKNPNLNKVINLSVLCVCVMFISFKLWGDYEYVYREQPINQLDTKIETGVWKGIYTTEERAKSVVELEDFLDSITEKSDDVLCLDWVSFGYVMINGKMCSPTTLDPSCYSYGINKPNIFYDYFTTVKRVPNKILYISYGRDEYTSVHNQEWNFSEFVLENYTKGKTFCNDIFSVEEYIVIDADRAYNSIKDYKEFINKG